MHAFFDCPFNEDAGKQLVEICSPLATNISPHKILKLDWEMEAEMELPVVWLTAAFLLCIWNSRSNSKRPRLYTIRAELESKVSLLRETRYSQAADQIIIWLDNLI